MPALTFVGRLMPAENTYDWTLRNRETKRAASARYSSRGAPIRVSHLVLARARARAQYRAVRKMRAITIIRT